MPPLPPCHPVQIWHKTRSEYYPEDPKSSWEGKAGSTEEALAPARESEEAFNMDKGRKEEEERLEYGVLVRRGYFLCGSSVGSDWLLSIYNRLLIVIGLID